jgi:hypothetical protein
MKALEFFVLNDNSLRDNLEGKGFERFKFLLKDRFYMEVKKEKNIRNLSTDSLDKVYNCKIFYLDTGACKSMDISKEEYDLLHGCVDE